MFWVLGVGALGLLATWFWWRSVHPHGALLARLSRELGGTSNVPIPVSAREKLILHEVGQWFELRRNDRLAWIAATVDDGKSRYEAGPAPPDGLEPSGMLHVIVP